MKYSDHNDFFRLFSVQHDVWKSAHDRLANVAMDFRVKSWILGNSIEHITDFRDEISAQSDLLFLVSIGVRVELGFGFGYESNRPLHFCNRASASAST